MIREDRQTRVEARTAYFLVCIITIARKPRFTARVDASGHFWSRERIVAELGFVDVVEVFSIVDLNLVCALCSLFRFRFLEFLFKVFHRLFLGRFLLLLHVGEVEVFGGDRGGRAACRCGRARGICGLMFRDV